MSSKWFETWFDTPYYHLLYKNRDDKEAEFFLTNLLNEIHLPKGSVVADIPCGKGRHALFLNQQGFDVTGLDLSASSIKLASAFQNDKLHFAVHDMRKVYRPGTFDAIFNLFTSLGYFENEADNLSVLQAFYDALKPGGYLIIDFFNTTLVCGHLKEADEIHRGEVIFRIRKQIEHNHIIKNIEVHTDDCIHQYREQVQLLSRADLEQMLKQCGFRILNLFGDYTLNSFDEQKSERLIIKAQKTG